jgi:hypothetical protein
MSYCHLNKLCYDYLLFRTQQKIAVLQVMMIQDCSPQIRYGICSNEIHDDPLVVLYSVVLTVKTLHVLKLKPLLMYSNNTK